MEVTRNIIEDLLPLYLAGEVSPETRAAVEEFLARDPALAAEAASQQSSTINIFTGGEEMPLPKDHEAATLTRTRAQLQKTTWIFAVALAFTLVPLSFEFDNGHFAWIMVRDVPRMASAYWVVAAGFWIGYILTRRRLRSTGI